MPFFSRLFDNGIAGMLGGGRNNARSARQHTEQVPGYGREAYDPFIRQGQDAYNQLSPQYNRMLTNPQEIYNQDVQSYEPSAYYQFMAPQLDQSMQNTAAQGGYVGTDSDQMARANMVRGLMSSDLGSYLENIGNIRGAGMQGFESATGRGFQGAGQLADYLGTAATNRGNLEYAGKTQQGINRSAFLNSLMSAMAGGMGAMAGSGSSQQQQNASQQQLGRPLTGIQTRPPFSPERNFGQGGYNPYGGRR